MVCVFRVPVFSTATVGLAARRDGVFAADGVFWPTSRARCPTNAPRRSGGSTGPPAPATRHAGFAMCLVRLAPSLPSLPATTGLFR